MTTSLQDATGCALGNALSVKRTLGENRLTVVVAMATGAECVLHWGLSRGRGGAWQQPPADCWPEGTAAFGSQAVRTPFRESMQGPKEVAIHLELPSPWDRLQFVVYFPRENRWLNNGGKDFFVPIPGDDNTLRSPEEALRLWAPDTEATRQVLALDGGGELAVATWSSAEAVHVRMVCDTGQSLVLHWGLAWQFRHEWRLPPENFRPTGTSVFDQQAARTPFRAHDGLLDLELAFPLAGTERPPRGLKFALYDPDTGRWLKSGGKDMYLVLSEAAVDPRLGSARLADLAEQIVAAEKGYTSWTLMHRFNLCHDLMQSAQDDPDALALLFVWLRFSAIRQLDWQRRFNTKPRELSHAQDRLTTRLAGLFRRNDGSSSRLETQAAPPLDPSSFRKQWVRLLFTTLGRGGDGQRVRDEILQIMHRNHIKESSGHFMEEWHQKLHNNTTPDDVVICSAFLAFMKSNGDQATFYRVLQEGGVTRERLQSFERPIKSAPSFPGDRKDALIGEFEGFLRILKAVHSGTDLESAAAAARGRLDEGQKRNLDTLLGQRHQRPPVEALAGMVTSARAGVATALKNSPDDAGVRDLLFLDLALAEFLRGVIERQNLSKFSRDVLVELVRGTLHNVCLAAEAPELTLCASHWEALLGPHRDGRDWALHAKSVADRAARWVAGMTDELYRRLQPKAEFLGAAFEVEPWTVPLFSEEVIRGGPAFALALLLRHLDPLLRTAAGLGGWQVISPAPAFGKLRVIGRLLDVQAERFPEATVLVADAVQGNEEIPAGVTAVITTDAPDLVSHVAVRARNAHVLFATCFDGSTYARLQALRDRMVSLQVTPSGDVNVEESHHAAQAPDESSNKDAALATIERLPPPVFTSWVVTQQQFKPGIVGGKSNNLAGLRGRLPDWIAVPSSIALPFGVCERTLEQPANRALRQEIDTLVAAAVQTPAESLARVRALVQQLTAPPELQAALLNAWQRAGLPPLSWEQTWHAIRRVWSSKWNERAYFSRRARGIPHENLRMAVLIQQVVEADYAYVIHTANPLTGNRAELYAEVVLGLGETLVGNYPGRALGFVCPKDSLQPTVLSYPGKSLGLYGRGVIFRSDSNGEDLEGFAGAGLYDSYLAEEPEHRLLDYRSEKLVWDQRFRDDLLRGIARVGIEVERVLGTAQDIEGASAGGKFYVVQARPQVGLK